MWNEASSPSTICIQNSEWIAENIKGLDQTVKEMLLLVENDGVFSVEKPHDNGLMPPELIARVKEISHRHHLLADHYNKLTGGLSSYIQSANEAKNFEKSNSQLDHRFQTPDKKFMQSVVSSDLSLSSGGGISDTSPVEGSESSLLSSDSDSESYNLSMRLFDCEKELKVSKEKLLLAEGDAAKLKNELLKNEASMIKMSNMEAQLVSAENQINCCVADLEKEKEKSTMLKRQVFDLETKLESEKREVDKLQETVKKYSAELLDSNLAIQNLNAELEDASGSFALEKWQLESSVSKLSESLTYHEGRANELQKQCESLEAEKTEIARNQEAQQIIWQDNLECLKNELSEKNSLVDTLNKNLDKLKLSYNILMAEKDGVDAKLQKLITDLSVRNDQLQRLDCVLLELHSENEQLRAGSDSTKKLTSDLKSRIIELEKEMGMQAAVITDTAEGKREAIRQLCFSLDHFRNAYQELREEYAYRRRPAAMAS